MKTTSKKVRYAVLGLGWIAQEAVLPAFAHARENSQLTALISDDEVKLRELGKKYNISQLYSYKDYEMCLKNGSIDAVYNALPNALHREYTIRAAEAGIHVLCEKPMAMNEEECIRMMQAVHKNRVKLMIAYRLHFEQGNLKAIEIARSGKLGEVRIFNSLFSMNVKEDNSRLDEIAGGTLYDIGIYCINAARGIFRSEPTEVVAFSAKGRTKRFAEVDEMTSAVLRFPQDRLASFTCSFAASETAAYEIVGTKGSLRVDPAYHHTGEIKHILKIKDKEKKTTFPGRDQFAPELIYFSNSILKNQNMEPSGIEGLADVRIIRALYKSAREKKLIHLKDFDKSVRPSLALAMKKPEARKPQLVHAKAPQKNK